MNRGARIAIAVLSVLLALAIGGGVWVYVADRAAAAEWALKDQERVAEITELAKKARFHSDRSDAYKAEADSTKEAKAKVDAELAALRAERRQHEYPKTLSDCRKQLVAAEAEVTLQGQIADLDAATIVALESALAQQSERARLLETALVQETERADGWREYSRKSKRRSRVKLAFIAIGAGAAGGLAGYGVGVSR